MKYAAININFDSLSEMYGFPKGYRDPSFFEISKRFFSLSEKYGFKYSIYVIGKDLEEDQHARAVKEWSDRGHEIGNHSWSHPLNLGALPPDDIRRQVRSAHEIIARVTGRAPRGFIAPGWSTSKELVKALIEMDYVYDTSTFPSWVLYPMMAKMLWNHKGGEKFGQIFLSTPWEVVHQLMD